MRTYPYSVSGERVTVHVPESPTDLDAFRAWVTEAAARGALALDTETSGLDVYSDHFRLRTVQFGDAWDAWVIHFERGGIFADAARWVLNVLRPRVLIHNAPYDWLVLDQHAGVPLEQLAPLTRDTQIMAKLCDPRQPSEGGVGAGLKPLSAHYVDPDAADTQAGLHQVFAEIGATRETGWARIPLTHPLYNLYAGLDTAYTARLYPALSAELSRIGVRRLLAEYEHELARICAVMQRTGMVLDTEYTRRLDDELSDQAARYAAVAARYGVANVNSTAQLAAALAGMGEELTERTASGNPKVDKSVLLRLADLDLHTWEPLGTRTPNPLADAAVRSKRAGKWRASYVETFLRTVDSTGRIHPMVNTLQARTGRMSITRPALQTLPSRDQMIRRAMLADEGHVTFSCDFDAVEMRVLAALADVTRMKAAITAGNDLHDFTAELVYGPGFTPHHRTICKSVGFGKVYGGGVTTISRQSGAGRAEVAHAIETYDRVYPEIRRFAKRHERIARANGMVTVTLTGRHLPLDPQRAYAVTNYQVQSAARDVLGQALIDMDGAGLLPYLRLPVHDEVVGSAPAADAAEIVREIERCMTTSLGGVPITAGAKIGKRSWGSLYGADY
ncbi:DNA polymerase [Streptomyces sp. NPDC088768]|uniref:DNA polymerase n=1 Tax=Streptomyces sp. NPDC088768 TaxID=3365894 RepID=UPI003810AB61